MIDVAISQLSKYFGATQIFDRLSMDVKQGERIGLIGPNGCGKTTLMKILTGEESYDEGTISLRKGLKLGYLSQMPSYESGMRVVDVMTLAFSKILSIREQMAVMELRMAELEGDALEKLLTTYGEITHKFENAGGYEMEMKLSLISEGLNISEAFKEQLFDSLSGGEKTRVELAKTLLEAPDVLLLDEPSNHLDMASIEWLEEYLKGYEGTTIIISHDRYFLDRVVTRILEMTFDKLIVYHGNYSHYVVEKERRFLLDMKYYEQEQKKIKRVEEQIKRYRVWGEMRDSDKMYRKAKELEKRLEKMDKMDRPVFENAKVKLKFDHNSRTGKRVLNLSDVSKSFDEKVLFTDVEFELFFSESVCLIGDNGTGKSTLLKMILGDAMANEDVITNHMDNLDMPLKDTGHIKFGSRLNIGYLPQEVSFENETMTILEYFQHWHGTSISEARRELAKVLFVKDDVNKKIGALSGGEKSRLKLCSLMYDKVNLMVLDEPTNHLDIDSREILEETLLEFGGTILFVSHDRYFIAKIANRIAEIERLRLHYYAGNFEYYRVEKEKASAQNVPESVTVEVKKDNQRLHKRDKKVPQKYIIEYEGLEKNIEELEDKLASTQEQMAEEANNAETLAQLYKEEQTIQETLSGHYQRWEELSSVMSEYS